MTKVSYTIACASGFRDAVLALAARRQVNAGDLARSVLLAFPAETVAAFPDPGGPSVDDRERVVVKSGEAAGRPWQRKPRLQVRLPPGQDPTLLRRALAIALALDRGERVVRLEDPAAAAPASASAPPVTPEPPPAPPPPPPPVPASPPESTARLEAAVDELAFLPFPGGPRTRSEALYVLGYPPLARPEPAELQARYRVRAALFHPDGTRGDHVRMTQLNQAMTILRRRRM